MTADDTAAGTVDLTNCDREPIHQLGRVQSYGMLIAVSADWIVQHVSTNVEAVLGVSVEDALGQPLDRLIVADGTARLRAEARALQPDQPLRLFNLPLRADGASFDVCLHASGRHTIVELEPKADRARGDVMAEVYPLISRLSLDRGFAALAREAARALQSLCGFDSVMVYQFQPDHSGKVIAETRLDGDRRYLGQMFPASDIPAQARALYKRSLLRLIADTADPGAPILPPASLDGTPLDLSLAVTRAVSPIHIEYLNNMGVRASMSVSIMKDGELWGLFACHHDTPRYVDYERRTVIEMFGHLFSYQISRLEELQRKHVEEETVRLQTRLMAGMADNKALADSLLEVSEELCEVVPHDGIVLYQDETFHARGVTPTEEEFRGIARMLDRSIGSGAFATDRLEAIHDPARDYRQRCAGIIAIPISKRPRDYLVLCRRQLRETVDWAGNPEKPVTVGPNGARLTPRQSFAVWTETVEGRSAPWTQRECHAAELLRTVLLEVFLKITDAAYLERKRAQEQQQLLISELNHRVRNILNLMHGLLAQSRSGARTMDEFADKLDGRIQAFARAHDQLTREQWEPTSLKALILTEFEAYAGSKSERVKLTGADCLITPETFTTLALVIHELATNSMKYGALCDNSGRIEVVLDYDRGGALLLSWTERGGPPVTPPKRRGFGTLIIESSIPHELRGDADVSYKVAGLEARFRIPADRIAEIREVPAAAPAAMEDSAAAPGGLSGQCMVLEDTLIIAMDAADILRDMGAEDVKIVSSVAAALEYLDGHEVTFALLDVNLNGEQSVAVAEYLYERGTPFALATGYGAASDLAEAYPPCEIIQKPFSSTALEAAVATLLGG